MPIRAADGRILGTFANYYREPKEPTERDLETIAMVTRTTAIAIERSINEQARARAEAQRGLLLRELNHRVKNVFALADSLLMMSARSAISVEAFSTAVRGRLGALSRAHALVQPGLSEVDIEPRAVPLKQVIDDILAPYVLSDSDKVLLAGPDDVEISPESMTGIALVLHELATNAAKYGALGHAQGKLLVSWTVSDMLRLEWSERGSPVQSMPSSTGFGSTLVKRTVEGQFKGVIEYGWKPHGLDIEIRLPLHCL